MKRTIAMLVVFLGIVPCLSGCYEEEAKIIDDYWFGDANIYNGWAVAMDGNFAAIGNPQGYNVYNFKTGSVYIAERVNGDWTANPNKIAPSDLSTDDFFGYAVGMESGRLIVGASHAQLARVYENSPAPWNNNLWYEQDSFTASDLASGDNFGSSADISGNWAIVGSPGDDNARGTNAGSAYLFQWNGIEWVQRKKITASDGAGYDNFGSAVAIHGDYAVVGAPYEDNQRGSNAGSIYVFQRNGTNWVQQTKQIPSTGHAADLFGGAVAINGAYILAGARYDDNARGSNAGAAYFFVRSGSSWSYKTKLIADDGAPNDYFGRSVALTDYFATIGAPYDDNAGGSNAGACYVYYRSEDELLYVEKRTASDGDANDLFGYSTAMSGTYAVFGALYDNNSVGGDAGAAYIFEQTE